MTERWSLPGSSFAEICYWSTQFLFLPIDSIIRSQFEQPFEDTAALNLWSRDRDKAPDSHMRDKSVREHVLADHLEESVTQLSRKDAGLVFDALANGESSSYYADVVKKN